MARDIVADQLVFSTVKIDCTKEGVQSSGTGFFMRKQFPDKEIEVIVTNKHVLKGFDTAQIVMVGSCPDGTPDNFHHLTLTISNLQSLVVEHPDPNVDISFLNIGDMLKTSPHGIYYTYIDADMCPNDEQVKQISAIEDVLMIGYPNGLIDEMNIKPIVRKGITATSFHFNYKGQSDFLIDVAAFWGSSGSPVFWRREGLGITKSEKNSISMGKTVHYFFLGIEHAMHIHTDTKHGTGIEMPLNLAFVTKYNRILELFDFLNSKE